MSKRKSKKQQKRLQQKRAQRTRKRRPRARERAPYGPAPDQLPTPATLAAAMMELEHLGDEPEFADLASRLEDDLVPVIAEMIAGTDDDIQRLEAQGDEEGIDRLIADAKSAALNAFITPAFVAEVRRRLTRLSRRLRREGEKRRAAQFDELMQMLDTPFFPWPMFGPLIDAFSETTEKVTTQILLHTSVAEAAGLSSGDVTFEQMTELLQDPNVLGRLQERYETDAELRELLDAQFDQLYEGLAEALFKGELNLGLFNWEELTLWNALIDHRMAESDADEQQDEPDGVDIELLADALKETVRLLNTPARQARWRERLAQLQRDEPAGDTQVLLSLLQDIFADPQAAEEMENWLIRAYVGEHSLLQDRLDDDETLDVQFEESIERILTRLEQGEPPLL